MREYTDKNNGKDLGLPSSSDFYPSSKESSHRYRPPIRDRLNDFRKYNRRNFRISNSRVKSRSALAQLALKEASQHSFLIDFSLNGEYLLKPSSEDILDCNNNNP